MKWPSSQSNDSFFSSPKFATSLEYDPAITDDNSSIRMLCANLVPCVSRLSKSGPTR